MAPGEAVAGIAASGAAAAAKGGTAEDGTAEGGTAQDGTAEGGTAEGGTAEGGTAEGGTAEGGTAEGGTAEGGTAEGGTAEGGTAEGGTAQDGTAEGGTAQDGGEDGAGAGFVAGGRGAAGLAMGGRPTRRCWATSLAVLISKVRSRLPPHSPPSRSAPLTSWAMPPSTVAGACAWPSTCCTSPSAARNFLWSATTTTPTPKRQGGEDLADRTPEQAQPGALLGIGHPGQHVQPAVQLLSVFPDLLRLHAAAGHDGEAKHPAPGIKMTAVARRETVDEVSACRVAFGQQDRPGPHSRERQGRCRDTWRSLVRGDSDQRHDHPAAVPGSSVIATSPADA